MFLMYSKHFMQVHAFILIADWIKKNILGPISFFPKVLLISG